MSALLADMEKEIIHTSCPLANALHFKGKWRAYQERVLRDYNTYLSDGKIHIVAAPGSGKTTLGIELIRRLNRPVLILVPTLTIREQWKARIVEGFLNTESDADHLISQNLRSPSVITIATYQSLFAAMRGRGMTVDAVEDDEDCLPVEENEAEEAGFDVVATMKEVGMTALCLDECHHLRNEWWKALDAFCAEINPERTVSLTATPPYDSKPAEWKRYVDRCGEIDDEITIPELVKEGVLCPHQDYVCFNYPTAEEREVLAAFRQRSDAFVRQCLESEVLRKAVNGHAVFTGRKTGEEMLETPSRLSALLVYRQACGMSPHAQLTRLLGVRSVPEMDVRWMEMLLQYALYDEPGDFSLTEEERKQLITELKRNGLVERGKVMLETSPALEKMLLHSQGKAESLLTITRREFELLGDDLRMVVLTDYIRKEYLPKLGSEDSELPKLGVIPFFEKLRKGCAHTAIPIRLGVLCGSVVILPTAVKDELMRLAAEKDGNIRLEFASVGLLPETEYLSVEQVGGDGHDLVKLMTEVFARGGVHVLIGTQALLGEGWDAPCINTLVMASFVGSYMLSNQMRGRAIRVMPGQPEKTGNIWHLVCVKPTDLRNREKKVAEGEVVVSEDWELLRRRMEHFIGLHYDEELIVDGISRLSCIKQPFTVKSVKLNNDEMLRRAANRAGLRERWMSALAVGKKIETVVRPEIPDRVVKLAVFLDSTPWLMFNGMMLIFTVLVMLFSTGTLHQGAFLVSMLGGNIFYLSIQLSKSFSPYRRLLRVGKCVASAMAELGYFENSGYVVEADTVMEAFHSVYVRGGTGRDKSLFARCMQEMFAPIDNQRYLIVCKKWYAQPTAYYAVPELFAAKRETADLFARHIKNGVGSSELVYTRSERGRRILLDARRYSWINVLERIQTKKRVKSALE